VTTEASSETRNNKHPGNNANKKEEMNKHMGALKQFLKFKGRVIWKQKEVIQEMKERRRKTEEVEEEMKLKIAAMERMLEEKDRHNRTPDGEIEEMQER